MFAVLLVAIRTASDDRWVAGKYKIIAVVDGEAEACVNRTLSELGARGWTSIEVERVAPVIPPDDGSLPGYISSAVEDAENYGFGLVVYENPARPA